MLCTGVNRLREFRDFVICQIEFVTIVLRCKAMCQMKIVFYAKKFLPSLSLALYRPRHKNVAGWIAKLDNPVYKCFEDLMYNQ